MEQRRVRRSSVIVRRFEDQAIVDEVLERFRRQIGDLRERSGHLSVALREASRGLSENGRIPARLLIADLRRFRGDFRDGPSSWRSVGDVGRDGNGPVVEPSSIAELEQDFEQRVAVRGALMVLDRLEVIRLTDERDSTHWQRCLTESRALRRELAVSPSSPTAVAEAKRLASGDHPLGAVVSLIADRDELSDERWRSLHETVVECYGRDLNTAIVRQRLTMPSVKAVVASNGL